MSQNPINHNEKLFSMYELVNKIFFIGSISILEKFLKLIFCQKNTFFHVFQYFYNFLREIISPYLCEKTEKISFSVDKIFQKCRMTILMLQKDSPESGEHFKCLQSIYEVSRRYLQANFQQSYIFKKAFLSARNSPNAYKK